MRTTTLIYFLLITIKTFNQLPPERPLYPNGIQDNPITHPFEETYVDSPVHRNSLTGLNRVYSYVSEPTYMIFPANEKNNKKIGLVIFPGGGLRNVWLDKEGTDIALWLSEQGITCMVVKYRTNRRKDSSNFEIDFDIYREAIIQDGSTSILTMKSLADSLNFNRDRVGVMGFSAGGYVSQLLAYRPHKETNGSNPDFVTLIYHGGLVTLHDQYEDIEDLPPFFMAAAGNDYRLNIKEEINYLARVAVTVKKSELHIYRDGGHGFGLAYDENSSVSDWKNAFVNWIDSLNK